MEKINIEILFENKNNEIISKQINDLIKHTHYILKENTTINDEIKNGNLENVKFFYYYDYSNITEENILIAIKYNHLHIIKWLYEKLEFCNCYVDNDKLLIESKKYNIKIHNWLKSKIDPKLFL